MIFIIIPLISAGLALVIKWLMVAFRHGNPWQAMWSYGGMPSMHTAVTVSLCLIIYLQEGLTTSLAISLAFALLIIIDALLLRRLVGQQSLALNKIITQLPDQQEYQFPIFETKVGHTVKEVLGGFIIGLVVALVGWLI